jgi:hypothetical protein
LADAFDLTGASDHAAAVASASAERG